MAVLKQQDGITTILQQDGVTPVAQQDGSGGGGPTAPDVTFTSIPSNTTSWVATAPGSLLENQILVAFLLSDDIQTNSTGSSTGSPTGPSGWTELHSGTVRTDSGGDVSGFLWYHQVTAAEEASPPTDFTWTFSGAHMGSVTIARLPVGYTLTGLVSNFGLAPPGSASVTVTGVTTPTNNSMLLAFMGSDESTAGQNPYWAEPPVTGFTSLLGTSSTPNGEGGSATYAGAAYQVQATAGASGDKTMNVATLDDSLIGYLVAFGAAVTATVPDAITDLAGTPGDTQVVLTHSAPADNGSAITDYIFQYREVK